LAVDPALPALRGHVGGRLAAVAATPPLRGLARDVSARPPLEDQRRDLAAGLAALRVVAAGPRGEKGSGAHGAGLRALADPRPGDGLVSHLPGHRPSSRSGPHRWFSVAADDRRPRGLVLSRQGSPAGRSVLRLSALAVRHRPVARLSPAGRARRSLPLAL